MSNEPDPTAALADLAVLEAYAASRRPTQPAPDPDFAGPSAKLPVSAFTQPEARCADCKDTGRRPAPAGLHFGKVCDCAAGEDLADHYHDTGRDYPEHES